MSPTVWYPIPRAATRQAFALLDTEDHYDAWTTGREAPESADDGQGLRVTYDGSGTIPCVSILGPDGEIELRGLDEIRAAFGALRIGLRYAEAFGPPIPYHLWRQLHED